jgi:hypothetical protein
MLMQFDPESTRPGLGVFTPVRAADDMRLFVASRAATSEPSQIVHGDLRARFDSRDRTVNDAMPVLAGHAVDAAAAFAAADVVRLGAAMGATFDKRASILDLARGHVEMIEAARAAGCHANFTGSGGSVVVLAQSAGVEAAARQSLNKLGCMIVSIETAAPDAEPGAGWRPAATVSRTRCFAPARSTTERSIAPLALQKTKRQSTTFRPVDSSRATA